MISKCANPACLNRFLYFHTGKLFRFERRPLDKQAADKEQKGDNLTAGSAATLRKGSRGVEFFWLCDDCAAVMTLVYQAGIGVMTQRLRKELKAS